MVDSVVGKFEQIDYAVALDANGKVLAVEILAYREGHGGEVRLPAWRNQFVGKTAADPLRIGARHRQHQRRHAQLHARHRRRASPRRVGREASDRGEGRA